MRPTFFNYARLPHHSATSQLHEGNPSSRRRPPPQEWNFPAATLQRVHFVAPREFVRCCGFWVCVCDKALGLGADARMLSIRLDLGQMRVGRRVHLIIRGRPGSPICRSFSLAPPPQAVRRCLVARNAYMRSPCVKNEFTQMREAPNLQPACPCHLQMGPCSQHN